MDFVVKSHSSGWLERFFVDFEALEMQYSELQFTDHHDRKTSAPFTVIMKLHSYGTVWIHWFASMYNRKCVRSTNTAFTKIDGIKPR